MYYREMQDIETLNMGPDSMPNAPQMPMEPQINPMQQPQMVNPQMPMDQTCPYMNQGMCMNPNMMCKQPMDGQMMDYDDFRQDENDFTAYNDVTRECFWNGYPYGGYYGPGWHGHNDWHGYR